jgi:hypothetical protein
LRVRHDKAGSDLWSRLSSSLTMKWEKREKRESRNVPKNKSKDADNVTMAIIIHRRLLRPNWLWIWLLLFLVLDPRLGLLGSIATPWMHTRA